MSPPHRPLRRALRALPALALLLPATESSAVLVGFSAELLEDDGSLYAATFWIDSAELADPSDGWIEDVFDFVAVVDGLTYVWGITVDDPLPFGAGAAFDTGGNLVAIETPSLPAPGYDSTINLRLLNDGSWTANTCIPLPTCNPDYLFGTYTVAPLPVPEPAAAALLAAGLAALAAARRRVPRAG